MKWNEVAERIERLIAEGKYITQDDIDHLIKDCKWTVQNYDPADSDKYDKMQYENAVRTLAKYGIKVEENISVEEKPVETLVQR